MRWFSALGTLLLATTLTGLPVNPDADAEILPEAVENITLATDLKPPPIDEAIGDRHGVVYLINLYAVRNSTDGEDGEEELTDDVIASMPGILEPVATVLLIVEADDEEAPVSLDDVAKDLENEGFPVEKVSKDGETKVIKVDFGAEDEKNEDLGVDYVKPKLTSNKVRRKRAPCLKCHLGKLMGGGGGGGPSYGGGGYGGGGYGGGYGSGGYGGGGCGGGCGGGGHQGGGRGGVIGVIPVVVVPVSGYPSGGGGGHYPSGGGGHYPSGGGGGCNTCQGGGGGGGGSWSQSSSSANAQSSSGTWGKR